MTTKEWPAKFGDEVLDYQWDWALRLEEGEEITSVEVTKRGPQSLTIEDYETNGTKTTVWVSGGGNLGSMATINLLATTNAVPPRKIGEQIRLPIKSR